MNPFAKRKVTAEERKAILAEARKTWDSLEHQHIFGMTGDEFVRSQDEMLDVVGTEYREPEPLTRAQEAELETRIRTEDFLERSRIGVPGKNLTGIAAIDKAWQEKEDEEMRKFLAPARDAESALSKMVQDVVRRTLRKASGDSSLPSSGIRIRPVAERQGLMPMLRAAAQEDPDSDATKFLAAYVGGDEQAQRRIARELAAA